MQGIKNYVDRQQIQMIQSHQFCMWAAAWARWLLGILSSPVIPGPSACCHVDQWHRFVLTQHLSFATSNTSESACRDISINLELCCPRAPSLSMSSGKQSP